MPKSFRLVFYADPPGCNHLAALAEGDPLPPGCGENHTVDTFTIDDDGRLAACTRTVNGRLQSVGAGNGLVALPYMSHVVLGRPWQSMMGAPLVVLKALIGKTLAQAPAQARAA